MAFGVSDVGIGGMDRGGVRASDGLAAAPARPSGVQYAQAASIGGSSIGTVETLKGSVDVTHADGTKATLSKGDAVFQGDVLETGADGTVGIVFADESEFSLAEDGKMTLDNMVYDPGAQSGSSGFSVVQGAFTFISGEIAKTGPDAMTITTPTATIGVRGTVGVGKVGADGSTTAALMSEKGGFTGELTFTNAAGTQTINQPFQAVTIVSFNAPPSRPFIMTPQQVGKQFGSAIVSIPGASSHLPDVVRETATQAVAQQQAAADQAAAGSADQPAGGDAKSSGGDAKPADGSAQPADGAPPPGGDAASQAFAAAIAAGATPQEAAAAAADAAAKEAIANGVDPQVANAAAEAGKEAFAAALAAGATPEQAMAAASAAASASAASASAGNPGGPEGGPNGPNGPAGPGGPEGANGQGGQGSQGGAGGSGDSVDQAFNDAVAAGATPQEAAAAAADAAVKDAIANGADPQVAAAAAAAGENAFAAAIANGASPEEAMASAGAAASAIGGNAFGGTGGPGGPGNFDVANGSNGNGFGGPGGPGFGGPGDFNGPGDPGNFNGPGGPGNFNDPNFGGPGFGPGGPGFGPGGPGFGPGGPGFGPDFGFGSGGPGFGSDFGFGPGGPGFGGSEFGFGPGGPGFGGPEFGSNFGFGSDVYFDPSTDPSLAPIATSFEEVLLGSSGNDTLTGSGSLNTNFYFSEGTTLGGTDTIDGGAGSSNQVSFDNLNDIKVRVNLTTSTSGTIYTWGGFAATEDTSHSTSTPPDATINFSDITQYMISDTSVAAFASGFTSQGAADLTQSAPITTGDILVMQGMAANDTGYVIAGTSGADTIAGINYTNGIIFGKGGGDTFNITGVGDRIIIGGETATDNVDSNGDMIPDNNPGGSSPDTINLFDYSSLLVASNALDSTGAGRGLSVNLVGDGTLAGGDAAVSALDITTTNGNSNIDMFDMLSDVGSFTGSANADTIDISGSGGFNTISGDAGDDTIAIGGSVKVGTIDGGTGTDSLAISNGASNTMTVSNVEAILVGGGNDTITLGTALSSGAINLGAGTDSLTLANGTNTLNVSNTETITGGTGADTITLGTTLSSGTIDLGAGTDSLTLANGGNNLTIYNTETITGGTGQDIITLSGSTGATITGGLGNDSMTGSSGADIFVYTSSGDGAGAGGTGGYDVIYSFVSGNDQLALGGALRTGIDDITADGSLAWATDNNAANGAKININFTTTDEALMITTANSIPTSDTINFANLTAAINYNNITSAAGDDALIAVQSTGGNTTAFYYYLENGTTPNDVSASELSILSTTDAVTAQTTDVSLV